MARTLASLLLVAALAVASTRATAPSDSDPLAAQIQLVQAELELLQQAQILANAAKQNTVAVSQLSVENKIAVAAFAASSKAGSGASANTVGSKGEDFDIQAIPTAAPVATKAPTAAKTTAPTPVATSAGSKASSAEVKTPAPTTSGASTLAPAAAALATVVVYAML